jgi:hypothetical protein
MTAGKENLKQKRKIAILCWCPGYTARMGYGCGRIAKDILVRPADFNRAFLVIPGSA